MMMEKEIIFNFKPEMEKYVLETEGCRVVSTKGGFGVRNVFKIEIGYEKGEYEYFNCIDIVLKDKHDDILATDYMYEINDKSILSLEKRDTSIYLKMVDGGI
jgi:hypothetical protein